MSVADPTTIDFLGRDAAGRVVLAMTEERTYAGHDAAVLAEDFRAKLNTYVYMIRSGQVAEAAGPLAVDGVDIVLYAKDTPTAEVLEIIGMAGTALTGDDVRVGWQLLPPPSVDTVLPELAGLIAGRAPTGWQRVELSVALVGDGLTGDMYAYTGDTEPTLMQPDAELIGLLRDLKRARWTPEAGTWLSAHFTVTPTQITPRYNDTDPPDDTFTATDLTAEAHRFPRPQLPGWWNTRLHD